MQLLPLPVHLRVRKRLSFPLPLWRFAALLPPGDPAAGNGEQAPEPGPQPPGPEMTSPIMTHLMCSR